MQNRKSKKKQKRSISKKQKDIAKRKRISLTKNKKQTSNQKGNKTHSVIRFDSTNFFPAFFHKYTSINKIIT